MLTCVLGVLLGVLLGCSLRSANLSETSIHLVKFPGEMLMRMLKMLIIPIIVTSVITGLASMDLKKSGRMGVHAVTYYMVTTTLAVVLGVVLVTIIQPGKQKTIPTPREGGPSSVERKRVEGKIHPKMKIMALGLVLVLECWFWLGFTFLIGKIRSTLCYLKKILFITNSRNLFPENIIAACFQVVKVPLKIATQNATNATNAIELLNQTVTKMTRKLQQSPSPNVLGLFNLFFLFINFSFFTGIIIFSIFFGIMLSKIREEGKVVSDFFSALNTIFMKMITVIIWYSPIGICSMLAGNLLTLGSIQDLIESLGMYMLTVILGLMIHVLITLPLIYFAITRKNPFRVFVAISQAALTALGTASSCLFFITVLKLNLYILPLFQYFRWFINDGEMLNAGTLPLSIQCLEQNLGIDERVTKFVLPLGATMNMDGTALLEGVAAITIAQMYQLDLSIGQIFTISVTATFASIGAAAIPSAGLVTLVLVLSAIGLPSEAVGLLWSIDWLLDRIRTCVNVTGDCMGAVIVQHLNRHMLNNRKDLDA
uniref:Amino acid transporter n=1 Tax=Ciona savignyi TaxID=51511 RepID=H2YKT0_CIOSA